MNSETCPCYVSYRIQQWRIHKSNQKKPITQQGILIANLLNHHGSLLSSSSTPSRNPTIPTLGPEQDPITIPAMTSEPPSYLADLQRNYSTSGLASPPGSLPFGPKPALLVIDVCIAHLTPSSPLYHPTRFHTALASTNTLHLILPHPADPHHFQARRVPNPIVRQ
ncbi:hypothetical protein BDR22DRAFT_892045 [Usnea florida]